jgi:hypothetical protein
MQCVTQLFKYFFLVAISLFKSKLTWIYQGILIQIHIHRIRIQIQAIGAFWRIRAPGSDPGF